MLTPEVQLDTTVFVKLLQMATGNVVIILPLVSNSYIHGRSAAIAIIESEQWEKAMMFKTNYNQTPMRMMIQYMPG